MDYPGPEPTQPNSDSENEFMSELVSDRLNTGTVMALAGEDYAIIAADTLHACEHIHQSIGQNTLFPITPTSVLGFSGIWSDIYSFSVHVKARRKMYEYAHKRRMSVEAISQMISIILYNRRFFPYNISNIFAGLDKSGKGAAYSYDSIGHCDRLPYYAVGEFGASLLPLLDNRLGSPNIVASGSEICTLPKQEAITIIVQCFQAIAKRESSLMNIITANGVEELQMISLPY